jgi:hypothetical protein
MGMYIKLGEGVGHRRIAEWNIVVGLIQGIVVTQKDSGCFWVVDAIPVGRESDGGSWKCKWISGTE